MAVSSYRCRGGKPQCASGMGVLDGIYQSIKSGEPTTNCFNRAQKENKPDPWVMTDADIAVYDEAFTKQDKDKDGFITLGGEHIFPCKSPGPFVCVCV